MQKLINALFTVAIVLAVGLLILGCTKSFANTDKAMTLLRQTTVMVNGIGCTGSGSVVAGSSGELYVLTNAHVCNCVKYKGELDATFEGGELLRAKVVKTDWSVDLCAAKVDQDRPALHMGKFLVPYAEVNTRGYPGGRLVESHGRVRGSTTWDIGLPIDEIGECPPGSRKAYMLNGNLGACYVHYTSTLSNLFSRPGSSGSPVVNDEGQLVGVISSFHPGNDYDAGMVPFSEVKSFLSTL